MKKSSLLGALCAAMFAFIALSANASLIGRLETSPGSGVFLAYYDDQLDITWAADANINGQKSLANHESWVAGLTIGGVSNWRLPNMDVNGDDAVYACSAGTQTACKDNEYGHLYWYGAGTIQGNGITPSSPGPFSNLQNHNYWSATEFAPDTTRQLLLQFSNGFNGTNPKTSLYFAMAVYDGDVSAVPIPAAVWLFGSGLLGLIGIARRKKAA